MEEKEVDTKPSSKKKSAILLTIVLVIAVGLVVAVGYLVPSEEQSDKDLIFTGELNQKLKDSYIDYAETAKINDMTIEEVQKTIDMIKIEEAKEDIQRTIDMINQIELTEEQKNIKMPQSVLDMTIFINDYQDTPIQDIQLLMDFAVASERGTVTDILNTEARIIYSNIVS